MFAKEISSITLVNNIADRLFGNPDQQLYEPLPTARFHDTMNIVEILAGNSSQNHNALFLERAYE